MIGAAPYADPVWNPLLFEAMIGGLILGVSGLLFYANMLGTVLSRKKAETPVEMPVAESMDAAPAPAWLDSWKPWMALTIVLISGLLTVRF